MAISDNIKKIRTDKKLTQQEFADRIGVKRNTVATYEMGRSMPTNAARQLICREFGIRREWLETGEGEMYANNDNQGIIQQLLREIDLDEKSREFLKNFLRLNPENRKLVVTGLEQLAKMYFRSEHVEHLVTKPDDEKTREEAHALLDAKFNAKEDAKKGG